jgi:hypothetical protein
VSRWGTFQARHRVLIVARTITSVARLQDVLAIFDDDPRLDLYATVAAGSVFDDDGDVARFLRDIGIPPVPWRRALAREPALALVASGNGPLHEITAPIVQIPHGAGYGKRGTSLSPDRPAWYCEDLGPERLMHENRVVPTRLVLAHRDELSRLARSCPQAVPHAVVGGDVCFDRLRASTERDARYRHELGVRDDQRVVFVSSTWSTTSLAGQWLDLVSSLLAEIPADEYRVVAALHPNVWTRLGPDAVLRRLRTPMRAGLAVMPPREGWRAALVASDVLVGDHGSVTLYGAALGKPLLLAAYDETQVAAGSPMAILGAKAPRLRGDRPLAPQLAAAATFDQLADATFEYADGALPRLRAIVYQTLGLPEPSAPVLTMPVPYQTPYTDAVTAHVVTGSITGTTVELTRRPEAVGPDPVSSHRHLAVDAENAAREHRMSAAVLYLRDDHDIDRLERLLAAYPGCRLAAAVRTDGGCLMVDRDRTVLRLTVTGPSGVDPALGASVGYLLLRSGQATDRLTLRVAGLEATVTIG